MTADNCQTIHMHESFEIKKSTRWLVSFVVISLCLILLKSFIVNQIALRGDGYLGYGMYKNAIREYKKALWLDPRRSSVWNWLGYTYKCEDDREKTIETYEKAIEINSQNRIAYYELGMIYALEKDYKRAKQYFLKASLISPKHKTDDIKEELMDYYRDSLSMLSICQERLGETEEAINTTKKILERYPQNETAKERIRKLRGGE